MPFRKTFLPLLALFVLVAGCRAPTNEECNSFRVEIVQVGSNTLKATIPNPYLGPYSYRWSTGVGDLSEITVTTFGTYRVTASDGLGCTAEDSYEYVSTNDPCTASALIVSISSSVDVTGNVTLRATPSQGNFPYTFRWSTGGNTESISAPVQGNYSVTVTDLVECTATASFQVACKTGCLGCDGVMTVTDIDGNVYDILKIGGDCWMVDNLRASHYRDGSPIIDANDSALWLHYNNDFLAASDTGTWCYYLQDPNNNDVFGKLYNWAAVNDPRGICPQGWRLPTDAEWAAMVDTVADRNSAGTLLKTPDLWPSTDTSNNLSGFSAVPSRERLPNAKFNIYSVWANFWTSTDDVYDPIRAYAWMLNTDVAVVYAGTENKGKGFSCRCIRE